MTDKNIPSPEEIQEEIEELMRKRFGNDIKVITKQGFMRGEDDVLDIDDFEEVDKKVEEEKIPFKLEFDYLPKDIKKFLDQYVIEQNEAKKALSIAVCDHYNHVKRSHNNEDKLDNYSKQNVLMLGPTGVGKTYLVKTLAKLIGVPFVKADATRFTETGYVGANVDDMVRDLVAMANGNIELAQYGIIYFDEADKIAGTSSEHGGKDISGKGVQYGLLKLMEETEIDLRSAHDMISQMKAFMDFQRKGEVEKEVINTKHILFIVSGSFSGLENIISKRLKLKKIGLNPTREEDEKKSKDILSLVTTKDFIDFGFEPEFIGRLPVRLSCQELGEDDLYKILKESKGSIIKQYQQSFLDYGIELVFADEALVEIARIAHKEKTGARGLMSVCEKIFREYKFELPSTNIKKLDVSAKLIKNPDVFLKKLLKNGHKDLN